jgi:hypothetical protein
LVLNTTICSEQFDESVTLTKHYHHPFPSTNAILRILLKYIFERQCSYHAFREVE